MVPPFVGDVMNLLWIAALAIVVLFEKVTSFGRIIARVAGVGFIAGILPLMQNNA
jgi:predicted metal-binding membrane protein